MLVLHKQFQGGKKITLFLKEEEGELFSRKSDLYLFIHQLM